MTVGMDQAVDKWMVRYDGAQNFGEIVLNGDHMVKIQFQRGPVGENGINGVQNEQVIELLLERLRDLNTKFPCRENALAITNIEQGLMWLRRRTELRVLQGVEGQNVAHQS